VSIGWNKHTDAVAGTKATTIHAEMDALLKLEYKGRKIPREVFRGIWSVDDTCSHCHRCGCHKTPTARPPKKAFSRHVQSFLKKLPKMRIVIVHVAHRAIKPSDRDDTIAKQFVWKTAKPCVACASLLKRFPTLRRVVWSSVAWATSVSTCWKVSCTIVTFEASRPRDLSGCIVTSGSLYTQRLAGN
jgi:hypothetical protein